MAVRKRSKVSRHRGSHTHGWGSKKKHRGSGNRGGAGKAGSGKRAQSNKPSNWGYRYFGKFERVSLRKAQPAINVGDLGQFMVAHGIAAVGGSFTIDLGSFGIRRLIGRGAVNGVYILTVSHASEQAQEKIIKAGGSVKSA